MNHVLFITPYYPPEKAAPAVRISETAMRLVRQGYQVTVLTTVPNYPTGIVPAEYRGHLVQQEMLEGVRVVRVWSYSSPNKGFLRRVLAQLSFGCLAPLLGGKAVGRPDVIIAESPPLFDAIAARLLAWYRQCPFIFLVSDLWPESAIQLGVLRNRLLIRLAQWLEWSTYQRASLVWAVTEGIRQSLLQRGLSTRRVFLLTNGVDTAKFSPLPQAQRAQARAQLGWDGHFTILYAGTHGLAHGLTTVLEAAELLQDYNDIRFVFAGDGAAKAELVVQAQTRALKNVTFLEPQPHDRMPLLLASADICLVPLRKLPLFEGALPSKMYEIMACARPIVLGVAGEARRMVEQEAGAAIAVEPEDAQSLITAILYLREHPEAAETLGQRGRTFVEARFDRTQLTTQLEARIAALLEWPRRCKVSPTTWRLALLIGDGIFSIALPVLVLPPPPHLQLHLSNGASGFWNTGFFWIYLMLASWSIAVHFTQAQHLNCAASLLKSPLSALSSLALMLIFCISLLYLLIGGEVFSYTRPLLLFLVLAAPGLCLWRVFLAGTMNLPRFRRQAVIVGVNAAGINIAKELLSARHPGSSVLGYINENTDGNACGSALGDSVPLARRQQVEPVACGDCLPVLGDSRVLQRLVRLGIIDIIIMAIDYRANPELFQVALEGAQQGMALLPVSEVYERTSGKIPVEHIGDQWYTALPAQQLATPLYICWRKASDLAFGIAGLVLLGLVLPILAPLIYLDSPGPIFFSQPRTGYRGKTFRMLKFRSMCTNAEHVEGGALGGGWTSRGDARVTRVGRFLRATHLDELPQALNIVRGEMSLIGPRPERPDYVAELEKHNPFYGYRLSTRPGLTGWAQVKYGYGSGEQDELVKLQYDLYYIKHQSFLLDVLIILKTIVEVVYCHGV